MSLLFQGKVPSDYGLAYLLTKYANIRLVFVGKGEVGKTALKKRFMNQWSIRDKLSSAVTGKGKWNFPLNKSFKVLVSKQREFKFRRWNSPMLLFRCGTLQAKQIIIPLISFSFQQKQFIYLSSRWVRRILSKATRYWSGWAPFRFYLRKIS